MILLTCNRPVQCVLFLLPYLISFWTGCYFASPLVLSDEDSIPACKPNVFAQLLGLALVCILALYLVGLVGNHQFKVYSLLCNLGYPSLTVFAFVFDAFQWVVSALLSMSGANLSNNTTIGSVAAAVDSVNPFEGLCLSQAFLLFWIPTVANIMLLLALPSLNEIKPRLYLGNKAAGANAKVLEEYKITHVLRLRNDGEKPMERKGVVLLSVVCTDEVAGDTSLRQVAPQAVQFVKEAFENNPEKNNVRVLVHCSDGCSRSAAMMVHILLECGLVDSLPDAVRIVRRARPAVDIREDLMRSLKEMHPLHEKSKAH